MKNSIIIGIIVIVAAGIAALYIRRRNMTFEGIVTDKDIKEIVNENTNLAQRSTISFGNTGNSVTHQYNIKVQTTSGKIINWQISEGKYQILNIGDHVSKRSGTTDIDITPRTQVPPPPQSTINQPPTSTISN